ncbi:MAG: hypothetical protein IT291_04055 [Deltaproteobacteria bacterium]|nr:hypothetical protein [Deltaproteobacteria bacterium]
MAIEIRKECGMAASMWKRGLLQVLFPFVIVVAMLGAMSTAANAESKQGGLKEKLLGGNEDTYSPPLLVKSDTLELDSEKGVFRYNGNVEVRRGELLITADAMIGHLDEKSEIDSIECDKNVVITQGDSLRATADHALYNVKTSIIELTEGPEFVHHGNALTADKVIVYLDEDRSEAEGDVRVKIIKPEDAATPGDGNISSLIKKGTAGEE